MSESPLPSPHSVPESDAPRLASGRMDPAFNTSDIQVPFDADAGVSLSGRRSHLALEPYGTFKPDSIHGKLFELQAYVESLKYCTRCYFIFVVIAVLVWPVAALLAIPVGMVAGRFRILQIGKVILVLASGLGLLIWLPPFFIAMARWMIYGHSLMYTVAEIRELIFVKKEMNFLDLVELLLSELLILLIVVFSWTYHDIKLDTNSYTSAATEAWKHNTLEYGAHVNFPKRQLKRLNHALEQHRQNNSPRTHHSTLVYGESISLASLMSPTAPPTPSRNRQTHHHNYEQYQQQHAEKRVAGCLSIVDVLALLKATPGWKSPCVDVEDHLSEEVGQEMGLCADLHSLYKKSNEDSLWPIDLWLARTQFYPEIIIDLTVGLKVATKCTKDLIYIIHSYMLQFPWAAAIVFILAFTRTILPRLWLAELGGSFWLSDPFSAAGLLVLWSTVVTFTVSLIWISLFYMVVMEYRRTLCQITVLSALVDARSRVAFVQNYLLSYFWFAMDEDQCENILEMLPILDIRNSSNAAAFWNLRQYFKLHRCSQRMHITILLEVVIIWLLLKFLATCIIMTSYGGIPAILVETLFDIVVFGSMTMYCLHAALQINELHDGHKQPFVEAKYMVTMEVGKHRYDTDDAHQQHKADLTVSRHFLTEFVDMVNDGDFQSHDRILFGQVVTPTQIVSSLLTFATMAGALLGEMIKDGSVKAPQHSAAQQIVSKIVPDLAVKSLVAKTAKHTVTKFLQRGLHPSFLKAG